MCCSTGTATCWLHVVSTGLYTLIHASSTRGGDAIDEAGVLRGYRGVVVHDRLAMYWKLKAKRGLCGAHLLRDFADVAAVATLAELDSSTPPRGDVLLAEVGDELWAALSVDDGHAVADPLRPSAEAVHVLAERRRQLSGARRPRSHRLRPLRLARA
jgi:hypothetical protein